MRSSSFVERLARQGRVQAISRVSSGSPEEIVLKPKRSSPDVIAATLAIVARGATMLRAKRTVEKALSEGDAVIDLPVVEDHLIAQIQGREGTRSFNGYTSCPLITRVGRAMLVEFDYKDNLTPSFPGIIAPLEELWISWLMKEVALKATYNAMLRGRA